MTNREIIERLKELGFEDRTESKYWTYPVYGGTMKQRCQDDTIDMVKDYGDNTITIGVSNDKWSFNGLTDDDRVSEGEAVWLNHDCDNEDLIRTEGAIVSIDEDGDSLIFTVRRRNRNTYNVYKHEIRVGFDKYDEEEDEEDEEDFDAIHESSDTLNLSTEDIRKVKKELEDYKRQEFDIYNYLKPRDYETNRDLYNSSWHAFMNEKIINSILHWSGKSNLLDRVIKKVYTDESKSISDIYDYLDEIK